MDKDKIDRLDSLKNQPGWVDFIELLNVRFDIQYKKLRKCKKAESTYDRINGELDGLEYAKNIVGETVDEERQNPEPEKETGGDTNIGG